MPNPSKANLVDEAYARLKSDIMENRMPPGFQVPEPDIALDLGMSRTPVREALLRLQADGLIELIPRRGARIVPISADDMREIYEILTALEPEAAAQIAARNPDRSDLVELETATNDMERALKRKDLDKWAAADARFHRSLLQLHGNTRMTEFVTKLFDQTHRVRILTLRMRQPPMRSTEEHREILRHISAGDAKNARRVFRAHRERAANELLEILNTYRLTSV